MKNKTALKKMICNFNKIKTAKDLEDNHLTLAAYNSLGFTIQELVRKYNNGEPVNEIVVLTEEAEWLKNNGADLQPTKNGWEVSC